MLINGGLGPIIITTGGSSSQNVVTVGSTYNTINAPINRVLNAEFFDGKGSNYYLDRANHIGTIDKSNIGNLDPIPYLAALNTVYTSGTVFLFAGSNITLSSVGNSLSIIGGAGGAGEGNNISISGNTAGTPVLISSGTFYLAGGNNITLSQVGNSVSIIASSFSQSVQTQGTFNSNQLTNYQQTSQMSLYQTTGNYLTSQSVQTQGSIQVQGSSGSIVFSNSNGITFGGNNGTITASYTVPNVPAQTSVQFSNSNNVSFGLNGSTLTATASFSQSVQTQGTFDTNQLTNYLGTNYTTHTHSQYVNTSQSSLFALTANDSLSLGTNYTTHTHSQYLNTSQSSLFQSTGNYLTSQSNQAVSGSNASSTFQTISFGNSNGLSLYLTNGSVVGSYTVPSQSNQTLGIYASSNTTGQSSSSSFDARSLSIRGAGIVSVGLSGGQLIVSASAAGAADGVNILAAGTQTANTTGTVVFSNSNNVSFGMSNNSVITASALFNQTVQTQNMVSVQGSTGNISFSNSNGITFGFNGSTITASHNGLTSQSNQAFSASGGSSAFQTLNFANSNGFTFSNSNGSVIGSYTVPGATVFSNSNNVSFGLNGSTVTATATFSQSVQTQSNVQGISAGTQVGRTGDILFANSNGISFGMSGSSQITASYTVPTQTVQTQNLVSVQGSTGNVVFSNANNVTFGFNASTVTASASFNQSYQPVAVSGSNGSFTASTLTFGNLNGMSFYTSNGSIVASYTDAGAGGGISAVNLSAGTTSNNLTNFVFSNANNVSFGLDGSTVTASFSNTSSFDNYYGHPIPFMINTVGTAPRQSTSAVFPLIVDWNLTYGSIYMPISASMQSTTFGGTSINTSFTGGVSETMNFVLYQKGIGASSLSLRSISSFSQSQAMTMAITANSTGSQYTVSMGATVNNSTGGTTSWSSSYAVSSGTFNISTTGLTAQTGPKIRVLTNLQGSLSGGQYWVAMGISSTTATQGIAALTQGRSLWSNMALSNINNAIGFEGISNNASIQIRSGIGSFSTAGGGTTASLAFSNISSHASHAVPYLTFVSL